MTKYRILQNEDHVLLQRKTFLFWRYFKRHETGSNTFYYVTSIFSLFKCGAKRFDTIDEAENCIIACKKIKAEHNRKVRKQNSKYKIIYPKVDSPLYQVLNEDDDE